MDRDDIIKLAREAGALFDDDDCLDDCAVEIWSRFADLVASHERDTTTTTQPKGGTRNLRPVGQWPTPFSPQRSNSVSKADTANMRQEGGAHYINKTIQPWDYIIANNLGYLEGNIVKYVSRYKDKNGVNDLMKARHYLDKLIETLT